MDLFNVVSLDSRMGLGFFKPLHFEEITPPRPSSATFAAVAAMLLLLWLPEILPALAFSFFCPL